MKQGSVNFPSLADHYNSPCRLWKFCLNTSSTEQLYPLPELQPWVCKSSSILELLNKTKKASFKAQLHGETDQYRRLPNQVGRRGEGHLDAWNALPLSLQTFPYCHKDNWNIRKPPLSVISGGLLCLFCHSKHCTKGFIWKSKRNTTKYTPARVPGVLQEAG